MSDIAVIALETGWDNFETGEALSSMADRLSVWVVDRSKRAVVIMGEGGASSGGTDLGSAPPADSVGALADLIENYRIPVIAALQGNVAGNGLEIALACHYRVAAPNALIRIPQIRPGVMPCGGATQRLPRLVGVEPAITMSLAGSPTDTARAVAMGLVDLEVKGPLLDGASAFARSVADPQFPHTRDRAGKPGRPADVDAMFAAAGAEASAALLYAKRGLSELETIPDIPADLPTLPLQTVGVIGAGTMGAGIAMAFANAGFKVVLKDLASAALDRGLAAIKKNYAGSVKRGRLTEEEAAARMGLILPTLAYSALGKVDLVVEAAFENLEVKQAIFRELDRVCDPSTVLASNTSSLDIDAIAAATERPSSVVGIHFFSPANVMRLVEIVRAPKTSKTVAATCLRLSKQLGKIGVLVGNCPGFVGNRMFGPYLREAQFLVEEGATPQEVDRTLKEFGMAMGPLATSDGIGLDIGQNIRQTLAVFEHPNQRRPLAEDRLCAARLLGQKNGAGWYRYDENRRATPNPEALQIVRDAARLAGIPQRVVSSAEILDRCLLALVNEGARILAEGIALRAVDIDAVFLYGFGFPAYRGGPMWYAGARGLNTIVNRMEELRCTHGEIWAPAPLLRQLAVHGKTFVDFADGNLWSDSRRDQL